MKICSFFRVTMLSIPVLLTLVVNALALDPWFATKVDYTVDNEPHSVFSADLDGDGDADLAVANYWSDDVSILINSGDGTFQAAVNYPVGAQPECVVAADLDGDGDYDLVVANWVSNSISLLWNNGNGTFLVGTIYAVINQPYSVIASDLDGDGDNDLAVTNMATGPNVSVFMNNGDGTFQGAHNFQGGYAPFSIASGDLDGDGDIDLAVANWQYVSVLMNRGNGTFYLPVNYNGGIVPWSVFVADLDDDGDNDLAVSDNYSNSVLVLKNNGNGTFQTAVEYAVGGAPWTVVASDLDGDGDNDLAVTINNLDRVSILENNGDGTYLSAVDYQTGEGPNSVFACDLEGDGDVDLAVANLASSISVLLNLTAVNYPPLMYDIPDQEVAEGSSFASFDLNLYVDDPDNTPSQMTWTYTGNTALTVEITNVLDVLLLATVTTPGPEWFGSETITFRATDPEGQFAEDAATFTVTAVNDPPVVADIPDQEVVQGTSFDTINLDEYVSDLDNTQADMVWSYSGNTELLVDITERVATITVPDAGWSGSETITFRATDPGTLFSEDVATFTVTAAPGCCSGISGNVDGIGGEPGIDIGDLIYLIEYSFSSGPEPICLEEADVDGSGTIDITDLIYLVDYSFSDGPAPVSCP